MMIGVVKQFFKASSIVGALSIGLSIPGLWLYARVCVIANRAAGLLRGAPSERPYATIKPALLVVQS